MTSILIGLLMPLRNFTSNSCHAKFGCNWTTNKGETEHCFPSAYVITKYPSLNRFKDPQRANCTTIKVNPFAADRQIC